MKFLRRLKTRDARWYTLKPKIRIWVNFRGPFNGRVLVLFMAISPILRPFGIFYPVLVCCTKETLATLLQTFGRGRFGRWKTSLAEMKTMSLSFLPYSLLFTD
jgi:hypothetical protein